MTSRDDLRPALAAARPVRWEVTPGLVSYPDALARMESEVAAIHGGAPELVWLVEHPPLYTAGTSAHPRDLVEPDRMQGTDLPPGSIQGEYSRRIECQTSWR